MIAAEVSPQRVLAQEHDFLSVSRALVGALPAASVRSLLARACPVPSGLTPGAMAVFQQTLARGGVYALMARGGAVCAKTLRGATVVQGRLWDRHPPLALRYGRFSFVLCQWLLGEELEKSRAPGDLGHPEYLGDHWLGYLAADLLEQARLVEAIGALASRVPLVALAFPDVLRDGNSAGIATLLESASSTLLEALAPELTQRYVASDRRLQALADADLTAKAGATIELVLEELLASAERAGRLDLLTPLVLSGNSMFPRMVSPTQLAARRAAAFEGKGSLAGQQRARQGVAVFARALVRMGELYEKLCCVGFVDDEYEMAQLVLSDWEPFGREGFSRVRDLTSELGRLAVPAAG